MPTSNLEHRPPTLTLFRVPAVALLTLTGTLAMTLLVWQIVQDGSEKAARIEFNNRTNEAHSAVEQRMLAYEQVLRGGLGLLNASENVTRDEWKIYVASLKIEQNFPGIQGIGFAKVIRPNELQRHIARIRAEGFPGYTISPEGIRDIYTSIIYLEPFNERNQRAFGYDMFSEATRRAAMSKARDSGQTTISGKVKLVQETDRDIQPGFLMYLPLYRHDAPIDTVEQRRQALIGYVYSPFRTKDLMRGILKQNAADIDLEIYDGTTISPETLMYDYDEVPHGTGNLFGTAFRSQTTVGIQGHTWTLVTLSTPGFDRKIDTEKPRIVAISGVIISLLFTAIAWALATHRTRALALANTMVSKVGEREAFIQALLDCAADGIITIDANGTILTYNHAAEIIFGYTAAEVVGKNVKMLMPEPYHSCHDDYLATYLQGGEARIIGIGREVPGLRKNGQHFPLELAVSEIRQDDTRIFTGIVRDITKRKETEEALRRSEERFDLAIRGANDGLWDWDLKTNKIYYSPRWKTMLGYAEHEIGDALDEWTGRIHPDDKTLTLAAMEDHIHGKTVQYQHEYRLRHKTGEYIWILSRGIAQRDANGQPLRVVGIITDITQRKQVEKLKNEFVSTVSHELRTPLTSIRGSLSLIAGGMAGTLPDKAAGLIDIALKNSDRLLLLINDLLDMDKIQSGKMGFVFTTTELHPLLQQAIDANKGYASHYNIQYRLLSPANRIMVNVDTNRLTQVISNLLSNAAKFSYPGNCVDITVAQEHNTVRVSVIDHGVGIAEAFQNRIFSKFTQADSSDSRHKGGTGLGLSIAKSLIERMHGQIGFTTTPGKGSTFYFTLPIAGTEAQAQTR